MRPFGHRDPGPIGAALADDDVVVGLICDGIHVDPVAVRDGLAGARAAPAEPRHRRRLGAGRRTARPAALGVGRRDRRRRRRAQRRRRARRQRCCRSTEAVRNLVAFTGCAVPDAVATVTSTPARPARPRRPRPAGRRAPGPTSPCSTAICAWWPRSSAGRWRGGRDRRRPPTTPPSVVADVIGRVLRTHGRAGARPGDGQLAARPPTPCSSSEHRAGARQLRRRQRRAARRVRRAAARTTPRRTARSSAASSTDQVDLPADAAVRPGRVGRRPRRRLRRATTACSPSSAASTCSCSASGPTATSASTSRARRSGRARGSRR